MGFEDILGGFDDLFEKDRPDKPDIAPVETNSLDEWGEDDELWVDEHWVDDGKDIWRN